MPLLRRRPVPLLPLPNFDGLADDAPVFYLKATGEVFLDYESYAARLTFLLSRTFQCEYSGKTNLDYFSALQSEKAESRVVRERFPDELKGRVLATVQFQVMGRLDSLVDLVYERYKDRYFAGEKVFVDLSGDKYFARISQVFPPQAIRDAYASSLASATPAPSSSSTPAPSPDDYTPIVHKTGTNLNIEAKKARADDEPDEYLYTVQLMDEEHKFEGSFMEVKAKALSRDRLAFSKSILKRYIRECVQRDASIGAPWVVKPSIAKAFGIETQQNEDVEQRNKAIREGKLAKRRKTGPEGTPVESAAKRRKTDDGPSAPSAPKAPGEGPKKPIKYPIEDLDLDPMSIHDGRVLRRVNSELPTLPPKPLPKRNLPVPNECFDAFIETWNMLNTFSKPLSLSPFTLDDYAGALTHSTRTPGQKCVLLAEIHASLTNIIGTDTSRVLGSTSAQPVWATAAAAPTAAKEEGAEGTPVKPEGAEDVEDTPRGSPAPDAADEEDGATGGYPQLTPEQIFFNRLVRRGISYGKRWDRQAKLKSEQGREGWERHLIGAICQRGGPLHLENFVGIMKHLFKGDPAVEEEVEGAEEGQREETPVKEEEADANGANGAAGGGGGPPQSSQLTDVDQLSSAGGGGGENGASPEDAYLTLPLADKLAIISYLCTLVMGSKLVRGYVDEAETLLTDYRKQRADVNKERKALQEQKATLDGKDVKDGAPVVNGNGVATNGDRATPMDIDSRPPSEAGDVSSRAPLTTAGDDEEEDQLATSDAESSVAPSETGSSAISRRQAALEEKRLAQLEAAKARSSAVSDPARDSAKARTAAGAAKARTSVEDKLASNAERDDVVEREFRRFQGVSRCRPLGRDRFFCRYWWFDGVGGMELVGDKGVQYGTGRLFVQGPSREDWELISDVRARGGEGEKAMLERRMREEVVEEEAKLVGVNEWAFYEHEEELDALQSWLNAKGTRELALKNAIAKWRGYILAGSKKRQHDLAHPELPRYEAPSGGRRSTRSKHDDSPQNTYLGWRNSLAKY
ncbi:hypothetical protein JCM1841_003769 [Sporobolomyces salmonicolor]